MQAQDESSNVASGFLLPMKASDTSLEEEAIGRYVDDQAELKRDAVHAEQLRQRKGKTEETCQQHEKATGVTRGQATSKKMGGNVELVCCILVMLMSAGLVYNSLAPSFYGMEWVAALISLGAGMVGAWLTHMLLKYLRKILTEGHFNIFVGVVTFFMSIMAISGMFMLHKSRAMQTSMNRQVQQETVQELPPSRDATKVREGIDFYNSLGMILLFAGAEWVSGLLLYRALSKVERYGALAKAAKENERASRMLEMIQRRSAEKTGKTPDDYRMEAVTSRRNRTISRSKKLMGILLAALLLVMILLVLFSGGLHAAEPACSFTLIAQDITGSDEPQWFETQKAVIRIIDSRKPCDEGMIIYIHDAGFSSTQYVVHFKMPPKEKIGYWGEEIKRAKAKAISEYLEKSSKIPRKRPSTELVGGIFLFGKILKEQPHKEKSLVLLSDMRPASGGLNGRAIAERGDAILAQMKANGLVADLRGTNVYVMGFSPVGLTLPAYKSLEAFWRGFFETSGCNVRGLDVGYSRPIE